MREMRRSRSSSRRKLPKPVHVQNIKAGVAEFVGLEKPSWNRF